MKILLIATFSILLIACGGEMESNSLSDSETRNGIQAAEPRKQENPGLTATQMQALEKAKGVEQTILDAAAERDKAMREKGI